MSNTTEAMRLAQDIRLAQAKVERMNRELPAHQHRYLNWLKALQDRIDLPFEVDAVPGGLCFTGERDGRLVSRVFKGDISLEDQIHALLEFKREVASHV